MKHHHPNSMSWSREHALVAAGLCIAALGLTAACERRAGDDHAHAEDDRKAKPAAAQIHDEVHLVPEAVIGHAIQIERAQLRALRPTITAPARVGFDTEAMAHVGSPLRGRIAEVKVRVGDRVVVGQELAILESPELGEAQAEFLQRRVGVQTAGPVVELARVAWERARGLYEGTQGVSLTEVQRREAEHRSAIAALRAAESAQAAARNRLELLGMSASAIEELTSSGEVRPRLAIRAAIDGIVVQREVTLGELVSPDREYLMVLADATKLWILADVPEARALEVRIGALAFIAAGTTAAGADSRFEGRVTFLSPLVDPATRTTQVRIEVPVEEFGLRPGMFVQAEIEAGDPHAPVESRVAVPESALQTLEGRPSIFVPIEGDPGGFRARTVAVGATVAGWVTLNSGLAEGEPFVAAGSFVLKAELGKDSASHDH